MLSVDYPSKTAQWSMWSPPILTWPQSAQASLAATPSQWRYTPKNSCPVVRRKRATATTLFRYLDIGPTVARVSHGFPRSLGHDSTFVNECGNNALCSSESQENIWLSQLGSLLSFLVVSLATMDPNIRNRSQNTHHIYYRVFYKDSLSLNSLEDGAVPSYTSNFTHSSFRLASVHSLVFSRPSAIGLMSDERSSQYSRGARVGMNGGRLST
ncbi:uncharacterized protein TNCV_4686201 [Trichonephila clavipes]|nr:uncharacterized protein TNCV_4686201 [Trichonephila clavipes]